MIFGASRKLRYTLLMLRFVLLACTGVELIGKVTEGGNLSLRAGRDLVVNSGDRV